MKHSARSLVTSLAVVAALASPAFCQKILGGLLLSGSKEPGFIYTTPNPATHDIYVTEDANPGVVMVYSGTTGGFLGNITVGAGNSKIVANPTTNRVYVLNEQAETISVINGATNKVIATILPVVTDGCPLGLDIDTSANQLVVLDACSESAYVLNGSTYDLVSTISLALKTITASQVNPSTHLLYVVNTTGTFAVVNLTTGTSSTVNLGSVAPQSVAVDSTLNRIYMADNVFSSIYVLNGVNNTLLDTIKPPTDPFSVIVNQKTHEIVASDGAQEMYFYHVSTYVLDGQVSISPGRSFMWFSVDPTANHYYVGEYDSNIFAFIQGPTP